MAVESNKPVGHRQDRCAASIVFLQADHHGIRPIAMEIQNMCDVSPAETVNRLVIVAHYTQIAVWSSQLLDDLILRRVGVLIFVHQQMIEPCCLALTYLGKSIKKFQGAK